MLARRRQAMDASVEIQRQAQGMRRMEALAGAIQEMADLPARSTGTDPDAIRPMIQQRAQAIREVAGRPVERRRGHRLPVGLRPDGEHLRPDRAGDRRALALRTDTFNARVLDAQRELTGSGGERRCRGGADLRGAVEGRRAQRLPRADRCGQAAAGVPGRGAGRAGVADGPRQARRGRHRRWRIPAASRRCRPTSASGL